MPRIKPRLPDTKYSFQSSQLPSWLLYDPKNNIVEAKEIVVQWVSVCSQSGFDDQHSIWFPQTPTGVIPEYTAKSNL